MGVTNNFTTNRRSIAWKLFVRAILMVGLLILFVYHSHQLPDDFDDFFNYPSHSLLMWASAGALFFLVMMAVEFFISAKYIKELEWAKSHNHPQPNPSAGYIGFKITSQVLMCAFVAYMAIASFNKIPEYMSGRIEKTLHGLKAEAMAKEEQERQEYEKNMRFEKLKKINPALFFYESKNKRGHLRRDLVQNLIKMGFKTDDSETYTLYSTDNEKLAIVRLINYNKEYTYFDLESNVEKVGISILDDEFYSQYVDFFKSEIKKMGFVLMKRNNSIDLTRPFRPQNMFDRGILFMRMDKETKRCSKYGLENYLTRWDAVEFSYDYSYRVDFKCMSKDEIEEYEMKLKYFGF